MSKLSEEDAKFLYVNGFRPSKVSPLNWIRPIPFALLRFKGSSWSLMTAPVDDSGYMEHPFAADNPVQLLIWAKLEGLL